jgi:hypothetical protein
MALFARVDLFFFKKNLCNHNERPVVYGVWLDGNEHIDVSAIATRVDRETLSNRSSESK